MKSYRQSALAKAAHINIISLNEHIAMPDWEKRLVPLFLFKGTRPYRIRALWNIAYAMFLAECTHYSEGVHLIMPDGDHGKLCGLLKSAPTHMGMFGIFNRLRASKKLTDSISKEFTEYVEYIHPSECVLQRVPIDTLDAHYGPNTVAWWRNRISRKSIKVYKPRKYVEDACYPYFRETKTLNPSQELTSRIYSMLPKSIPHEIRGDLCQDLIVAVLSDEIKVDNIPDELRKYISRARKFMPDRFGHISMDEMLPGTDDMPLIDTMTHDTGDYFHEII